MSAFSPSLYAFLAQPPSVEVAFGETVTTRQKETLDNDAEMADFELEGLEPGSTLAVRRPEHRHGDDDGATEASKRTSDSFDSLHHALSTDVPWSSTVGETALTASKETVDADAESAASDSGLSF
jgi:hypothetical protein